MGKCLPKRLLKKLLTSRAPKQKEARQLCGVFQWLARFFPKIFSWISFLDDLTGVKPFNWTAQYEKSFVHFKKQMLKHGPCFLHHHVPVHTFHVYTDASLQGLGALLFQERFNTTTNEKQLVLIDFHSRKTRLAEQKYTPGELEMLATKMALVHWRNYLLQRLFVLHTDCMLVKNLYHNRGKRELKTRLGDLFLCSRSTNLKSFIYQATKICFQIA